MPSAETALGWQAPAVPGGPPVAPPVGAGLAPPPVPPLEVGARLGDRYVVRAMLGKGGMGAVYKALDEKLGEEVALKVVGGTLVKTLRDEVRLAQKVAHPNVCRTYDLEEVDGQHFVKMEFVAGDTLAARLKRERKLPVDEAVRIARAVAAGLAAAHAQGIVHRDLKPSNVMLSGERVVLMDFGIARLVTSTMNTLAGTFGYMAPEQFANTRVDRRADLYGLGCLLYEMLAGELVFGAANPVELAARHVMVDAPDVRAKRPETPRWLARAISALLAKEPAPREQGLARLLAGPKRWKRVVFPAVALAAVAAAGVMFVLSSRAATPPPCQGAEHRLAGVWDEPAKQKLHAAFLASKKPYAERSYDAVARVLDTYAREWTAAVTDSCEATRVRGEQTEQVMTLREVCLDRRLDDLRALVTVLDDADADLVQRGEQSAAGLEPIARCANTAILHAGVQPPVEPKAKVDEAAHALAEASAQGLAGHQLAALNAAKHAERLADELHYAPYKAEALRLQGTALGIAGNTEAAAADCTQAVWQAVLGGRDDLAVDAAACAASTTAARNLGEARVWLGLARTYGTRVGLDALRETRLLDVEHLIAMLGGDPEAALAAQEKALAITEKSIGADSIITCVQEEEIGEALAKNGAYEKATPHFEHALALLEKSLGTDHPISSTILTNLGACYAHAGEAAKAHAAYDRALALIEKTEGEGSPNLVITLNNMADAAIKAGDAAGALVYLDRAKHAVQATLGDAAPLSHAVLTTRAEALAAAGRLPDARAQYDEVIALESKYSSPYLAATLASRGNLELSAKKWSDAATFEQRAVAAAEAAGGKDSPDLWQPLAGLGRAYLALGRKADARPLLERAIAIAEKAQVSASDLAPVRAALAKLGS